MATILSPVKFSLRYNSTSQSEETVSRSLSGLNLSWSQTPEGEPPNGVRQETGITQLFNTIQSLSTGTISNVRFISEKEVLL